MIDPKDPLWNPPDGTEFADDCPKCIDADKPGGSSGYIYLDKDHLPIGAPCVVCGYMPKYKKCSICEESYDVAKGRVCHDDEDDIEEGMIGMLGE